MIDQNLGNIRILLNGQILTQKLIQLHLIRTRLRCGVHRIKALDQRVKILIVAPVILLRAHLSLHEAKGVFPRGFSLRHLHPVSGYIPLYAALCALLSVSPACLIFLLKLLLQRFVQMQLSLFCLRHFQGISRLTFFILTDSLLQQKLFPHASAFRLQPVHITPILQSIGQQRRLLAQNVLKESASLCPVLSGKGKCGKPDVKDLLPQLVCKGSFPGKSIFPDPFIVLSP